jgi:hypothetical protein
MRTDTRHAKTKMAAFYARVGGLIRYTVKGDARGERIRFVIREGLLIPSGVGGRHKERGDAFGRAVHCMNLVNIAATRGIEKVADPESILMYLASAAEEIERIIDAVTAELDKAETERRAA